MEQARRLARGAALQSDVERSTRPMVVVECGAGTAVPTVRSRGEQLAARGATLIRIHVREPEVPAEQIGLAMGANEALAALLG